jgi:hypothetical protein
MDQEREWDAQECPDCCGEGAYTVTVGHPPSGPGDEGCHVLLVARLVACTRCRGRGYVPRREGFPGAGSSRCDVCGRVLLHGMWPFCGGDPKDHEGAVGYGFMGDFK